MNLINNEKGYRAFVQINLSSFHHNMSNIIRMTKKSNSKIIAVVKADGYGHGAIRICIEALKHGINTFGVATIDEGIELRKNNLLKKIKIIVLGPAVINEYPIYVKYNLDIMLSGKEMTKQLINWNLSRKNKDKIINIHCMFDTGMSRIGYKINDDLKLIQNLYNGIYDGIKLIGLCTHMFNAPNKKSTLIQFNKFNNILNKLNKLNINQKNIEMYHIENSKSFMKDIINKDNNNDQENDDDNKKNINYVRIGSAMYGYVLTIKNIKMYPLISLYAQIRHISLIKKNKSVGYNGKWINNEEDNVLIATLSIGYADGYPREMSNKKNVIRIGNYLYDIAGLVSMDMMMINLGNPDKKPYIKNIKIGDYACLYGPKIEHDKNLDLNDITKHLGKQYDTSWNIICNINTKRVPKIYI